MKFAHWVLLSAWAAAILLSGCDRKAERQEKPAVRAPGTPLPVEITDECAKERDRFCRAARTLYNNRKFAELEKLANELRATKAQFDNGSWKIMQFYASLECRDEEPETMWQSHDQIHREWIAAYPGSITARVAYADFLTDYAWHARGSGYASTVTPQGWARFRERLDKALRVLNESANFRPQCPMWWRLNMTIAMGQGWSQEAFHQLFEKAKAAEPGFWGFDTARAQYLLPRWHGNEGEWEYAAETEAKRPGSLGAEGYARTIIFQSGYYHHIFEESNASWPLVREGCETLCRKYPRSREILGLYCHMACEAKDRKLARHLFTLLNGRMDPCIWRSRDYFVRMQNWAYTP